MEKTKVIITAVLLVAMAFSLVGLQIGFILNSTFLQYSFYERILEQQEFYGQIRQLVFRMVDKGLPNGRDSFPYLKKAISEEWLERELSIIGREFFKFVKGKRDTLPIIPFYKLKQQVVNSIEGQRTRRDKEKLVQFWFDPLPDEVRIQDFMSTDYLWHIRRIMLVLYWSPWVFLGFSILIFLVLVIITSDWKVASLWSGSAIIASGALVVGAGILFMWGTYHSSIVLEWVEGMEVLEFPKQSVYGLLWALIKGFINPLYVQALIFMITGSLIINFLPIEDRHLSLIK